MHNGLFQQKSKHGWVDDVEFPGGNEKKAFVNSRAQLNKWHFGV